MTSFLTKVDLSQPWLYASIASILFNPIFWNLVARNEYRNKTLTKTFGSAYNGTVFLAFTIFSLGLFRDWVYHQALSTQPTSLILTSSPLTKVFAAALFLGGQVLVVTSIWALGLTGTYLGDYFGILMSHRVTRFPFNIMTDPMYNGSTMCFLGTALWYAKPAGIWLTGLVWVVYQVALGFEGPFTDTIYASAAASAKSKRDEAISSFVSSTGGNTSQSSSRSGTTQPSNATTAATTSSSYASAVADTSATNRSTLPSTDPRPVTDLSHLGLGNPIGVNSPKVSRTRSRARIVDDD